MAEERWPVGTRVGVSDLAKAQNIFLMTQDRTGTVTSWHPKYDWLIRVKWDHQKSPDSVFNEFVQPLKELNLG